jgi:peptide deformylase
LLANTNPLTRFRSPLAQYPNFDNEELTKDMAIMKVIQDGDPRLAQKSSKVTTFDTKLRKLVDDMFETMYHAVGVGLAGVQVGVMQRIIVVDVPPNKEEGEKGLRIALCNPEIIKMEGSITTPEGCLSVLGWVGDVERAANVVVKGLALDEKSGKWKEVRIKAHGYLARCFQHECDHLNGTLYTSRVTDITTLQRVERSPEHEAEIREELAALRSASRSVAQDSGA